ncbi:MAG TPA: sigma-70 factor domain-containing protein, partial [Anaerolineales bacterium]|nr:sigma-70 factor domain-containing protein [Anaerolineales bacterium]
MEPMEKTNSEQVHSVAVQQVIALGRQQGYITLDDLMQFFPEAEEDINQLDEVFAALLSVGIPYVEDKSALPASGEPAALEIEEEDTVQMINRLFLSGDGSLTEIDTNDMVGLYLKQAAEVPLLTQQEEIDLAKAIERGRTSRDELAKGGAPIERREELR